MAKYIPAYRHALPLTVDRLPGEVEELRTIHMYASRHDDILVLDELFCRIVSLEHEVLRWDQKIGPTPRVQE